MSKTKQAPEIARPSNTTIQDLLSDDRFTRTTLTFLEKTRVGDQRRHYTAGIKFIFSVSTLLSVVTIVYHYYLLALTIYYVVIKGHTSTVPNRYR